MTKFLHNKYKDFIRNKYNITSGGFATNNIEEIMCDFATEVAKDYIEQANNFQNQIKRMRNCYNCKNQGEDYYGNFCCRKNKSFFDCDVWEWEFKGEN